MLVQKTDSGYYIVVIDAEHVGVDRDFEEAVERAQDGDDADMEDCEDMEVLDTVADLLLDFELSKIGDDEKDRIYRDGFRDGYDSALEGLEITKEKSNEFT